MKLLSPTHLLTAAAILAATNASFAEVINVDIQGSGSGGAASVAPYTGASANGPIASGTTWNHFTVGGNPPNGDFLLDLNDDSGAPTTVDVTFGTGWLGSFADGVPNNLQGDRVFTSGGVTGDITIGGLTPSGAYNIALIAAVNGAGAFSSDFTIGGTTLTATGATGAGTNANGPLTFTDGVTHVLFSNILADGSGNITFSMKNTAGAANGVLSGLQIESAVADVTPPSIVTLDPADNSTGVSVFTNLIATFDENIAVIPGGMIYLTNLDAPSVTTIAATDGSQVSVSGAALTINPTSNLAGSTEYAVTFGANTISDVATSANVFADTTFDIDSWTFTTAVVDVTAPGIDTLAPFDGETDVALGTNLVATFDEDVQEGSGNILIRELVGGAIVSTIAVTSSEVTVSGPTVTIDPPSDLAFDTGYYVEIANGAIEDTSGNPFGGIAGSATWSFSTFDIVLFDDFSTDPNLATEWTEYGYFPSDNTTPTWGGTDGDLDISKPGGSHGFGLYRTGAQRTATDPVTLTVKSLDRTSGTWGFMGLMISAIEQPGYLTTADDSYTFALAALGGTDVRYEVRRTYLDGTSDFVLKPGSTFDLATNGPTTLNIVRNGDHYEFWADTSLFYTTAVPATGDTYSTTAMDSLVYFQIVQNGDGAMALTVDDFGIGGGGGGPTPTAFDTWADSQGLDGAAGKEDGQGDDPDTGGLNNLGEFGLGGDPLNGNDDGSLLHAFSDDLVGGDGIEEGILTILVRSGASFSTADPSVSAAVDGIVYTVAADTNPDVDGGGLTVTPTAAVTTGLPAAPAGYEYASFYISGAEGYFQVTVAPE